MTPKERHRNLVCYLETKVVEMDWRGVSDAANDLRVLEAKHPTSSHSGLCACAECDAERAQ